MTQAPSGPGGLGERTGQGDPADNGSRRGQSDRPIGGSTRARVLTGIIAAGVIAAVHLRLNPWDLLADIQSWEVVRRFFSAAFRPALISESGSGFFLLPTVLEGIQSTLVFAVAAMSLAVVAGLVLGFASSSVWWDGELVGGETRLQRALRNSVGPSVTWTARLLIGLLRSVHELLWAMMFLSAFGLSHATAVLAIALPYSGILAKIFSEMIDEAPRDAGLALRAMGGGEATVLTVGILPRALPDIAAYTMYRFECALRSSAVLGFFGYPTLGYYISASFENLYYREVWTYLYALFALIVVVEFWSGLLRRRSDFA